MGANAVTTVPVYTAGEVLTAADLNITNSGIPVFADSTARTAAFGGTGEKVLAEGQYAYLESDNSTSVYDGSNWVSVGVAPGLVFITGAAFTTATSVSLPNDSFSATYKNYRLLLNITALTSSSNLTARMRASGSDNTTSNYFTTLYGTNSLGSSAALAQAAGSSFNYQSALNNYAFAIDLINPKVAAITHVLGNFSSSDGGGTFARSGAWFFDASTQFDSFTFISSVASSMTGSYRLYGYSES